MGSNMIHGPTAQKRQRSTEIDSGRPLDSTIPVDSGIIWSRIIWSWVRCDWKLYENIFPTNVERQNRTPYMAWASNLRQTAPELRGGLEVQLYWTSKCLGRPLLALSDSKLLSTHPLVLSFVPNQNIIIR
jgi:hypothetical protein